MGTGRSPITPTPFPSLAPIHHLCTFASIALSSLDLIHSLKRTNLPQSRTPVNRTSPCCSLTPLPRSSDYVSRAGGVYCGLARVQLRRWLMKDRRKGYRERAAAAAVRRPELRRGWLDGDVAPKVALARSSDAGEEERQRRRRQQRSSGAQQCSRSAARARTTWSNDALSDRSIPTRHNNSGTSKSFLRELRRSERLNRRRSRTAARDDARARTARQAVAVAR
ncbi:hypothetical protein Scep_024141 [Stephania cephalantha]|uniref:Uncharacterized protein n=1 Tax=Stephania cephalantha TaxID=152367 RepID=A0AAP0HXZ7_9MAGN